MDALVTAYRMDGGLVATVQYDGSSVDIPLSIDYSSPNVRTTVCETIKMSLSGIGVVVDRVVLPDLYAE